jgi:hypothetical protein
VASGIRPPKQAHNPPRKPTNSLGSFDLGKVLDDVIDSLNRWFTGSKD